MLTKHVRRTSSLLASKDTEVLWYPPWKISRYTLLLLRMKSDLYYGTLEDQDDCMECLGLVTPKIVSQDISGWLVCGYLRLRTLHDYQTRTPWGLPLEMACCLNVVKKTVCNISVRLAQTSKAQPAFIMHLQKQRHLF